MAKTHTLTFEGDHMRFVYDDDLTALLELGEARITRASHVEPALAGGWTADMAPAGGPVLGPFAKRADALAAEQAWLADHGY